MSNPVLISDIEARWRPLEPAEEIVVQSDLDDAWVKLLMVSPGLESRLAAGVTPVGAVISSVASAVIRKRRNPDGYQQLSRSVDDATRSWTFDSAVSTGELYFTDEELAQVAAPRRRGGAFTIVPGVSA
ncbi:MAG: phage Gp19/Gp15/Gp42 family protein [Actinomycetota bacterium]|nr:phage Gp19/Gp15/Gp42 family protein [Actinomycetota bacterium]